MKRNVLLEKSFGLAVEIVGLSGALVDKREFVLSKQVLRSGTAVGALIREAQNAESTADFIHKLAISQKECDETLYWLELLKEAAYLSPPEFANLHDKTNEILRLLRSIILTSKQKLPCKPPPHS